MSESHLAYLSLGSNIEPELHLVRAIELLQEHGNMERVSSAWESESAGAPGPNYLNACLLLATSLDQAGLKERALLPIETRLGRLRGVDRFAPRTIDIDIVIFDDVACDNKYWDQAFVVIPLAEVYPEYRNPLTQEAIAVTAQRLRQNTWMEIHPALLKRFDVGTAPC